MAAYVNRNRHLQSTPCLRDACYRPNSFFKKIHRLSKDIIFIPSTIFEKNNGNNLKNKQEDRLKSDANSITLCYIWLEAVVHRCSSKNGFIKILQDSQKHLCWSTFLIKLQVWGPATLLKDDSNRGVFLLNLWNFQEHLFSQNSASSGCCSLYKRLSTSV